MSKVPKSESFTSTLKPVSWSFEDLKRHARQLDLIDKKTKQRLSKRAAYNQLRKIYVMPRYDSRCISRDFLRYMAFL